MDEKTKRSLAARADAGFRPASAPPVSSALSTEAIVQRIFDIRGHRVMLDSDLAVLYGVETRYIPRAVNRNPGRFPPDFAFQLSLGEWDSLKSIFGISKNGRGGRRSAPYVFTEHGALMLSGVLNSPRADEISILHNLAMKREKKDGSKCLQ